MTYKKLPSQDYLNKLFRYEPETGFLTRRISRGSQAPVGRILSHVDKNGYNLLSLDGSTYKTHRLIWKMVYGIDPNQIDHINGVRDDNRIKNIRSVTRSDNGKNMKKRKDNTTGVTGVYFRKDTQLYAVSIFRNGKNNHLGYFSDIQDAIVVRKAAEKKYGYHENHGRS